MTWIVLEEVHEKGKYLGKIVVARRDLTPEFLSKCREDASDKMGWKKYWRVLKEAGYDIEQFGYPF